MCDHIGDWLEYLHVVDEKLADAVQKLEQAILSGVVLGDRSQADQRSDV